MTALTLWTVTSAIAAVAGMYGIYSAIDDLRRMPANGNGDLPDLRLVAWQRLFAQSLRTIIGTSWTLLGIALIAAGIDAELSPVTLVLIMGNIGWTLVAVSDALVGRKLRAR